MHPKVDQKTGWSGATGLAEDVRRYGQWMRDEAEQRIGHLYPKVEITAERVKDRPDLKPYEGQELTVIAWLWARTVKSSNPAMKDRHVPLAKSFWLSKKKGKEAWVKPMVDRAKGTYRFEVQHGQPEGADKDLVDNGTKLGRGCKFRCLLTDTPIPEKHVKTSGQAGDLDATLLAVVCEGTRGRVYLSPTPEMEAVAKSAQPDDASGINAPLANDPRNLWCLSYGLDSFDKLFTDRQLTALTTFSDLVGEAREKVLADATHADALPQDDRPLHQHGTGPQAYADAVATYLAFAMSKLSEIASSLCSWHSGAAHQKIRQVFGRQAMPMVWDFAEGNPFSNSTGNFLKQVALSIKTVEFTPAGAPGTAVQRNATDRSDTYHIISTDPPYYDNIGYADLSDFFYVWLRRALRSTFPNLLGTMLTPKSDELIATPYRHNGDKAAASKFFEQGLGDAIAHWRSAGHDQYPATIFYAFKQAETDASGTASTGWETFLAGVLEHGFAITGTWPVRTEMSNRMVGAGSNALASSIVLACVPRDESASMATRREFGDALRQELPDAVRHLQSGTIPPVDLAQALIGPGMGVFSRYSKVLNQDGTPMTVREALQLINQVLDETLAEQEGEYDAWTRWAVGWFEQYGMEEGPYGSAEILSTAKGVSVAGVAEAGICTTGRGKVRLIPRRDLPADWDPALDERITVWEITQHLVKRLDEGGAGSAGQLLQQVGPGVGQAARDLAYRLFQVCERKKWAKEALGYNALVAAWRDIEARSREMKSEQPQEVQGELQNQ